MRNVSGEGTRELELKDRDFLDNIGASNIFMLFFFKKRIKNDHHISVLFKIKVNKKEKLKCRSGSENLFLRLRVEFHLTPVLSSFHPRDQKKGAVCRLYGSDPREQYR